MTYLNGLKKKEVIIYLKKNRTLSNFKNKIQMKKRIFFAALLSMSLSACNTGLLDQPEEVSRLKVKIRNNVQTKGLIEGNTLADGSEVGVTVLKTDNSDYDGIDGFKNVKFIASSDGGSQKWTPTKDILLSATKGTLYAYYPYSTSVTDISAVPVSATSENQTDYMYGTPVSNLNNKNATAEVTLEHALAAVRLNISKGSFSGAGKITAVSVSGEAIATGANLDTMTGELSDFTGKGTAISPVFESFTVSATPEVKDFIVIPTGETKPFTISIKVDGVTIEANTPAIDLREGVIAEFDVKVNSKAITIGSVSVTPWSNSPQESLEIL